MRFGAGQGPPVADEAQRATPCSPDAAQRPASDVVEVHVEADLTDCKDAAFYNEYTDISSLALNFVPCPFVSGCPSIGKSKSRKISGGLQEDKKRKMDASAGPRRFSTSGEERVGLLSEARKKSQQYGTLPDASELERLVSSDGTVEVHTTAGAEARILLKSSIPLMLTYLLQVSRPLTLQNSRLQQENCRSYQSYCQVARGLELPLDYITRLWIFRAFSRLFLLLESHSCDLTTSSDFASTTSV